MEIIVAKNIGFCFGVTRAINESLKEMDENTYFLGELIHNKETMSKLKGTIVNDIEEVPDKAKLIIRAHGVTKEIIKRANEKKLKVIDLTCPKVAKVHKLVSERKKNLVIIIGKKTHPEVIGTIGYADEYIIIEDEKDLIELENTLKNNSKKISIFSQTTFSSLKFASLVNKIKRLTKSYVEIIPCICPVTEERQKEALNIASNVDFVIVVGGKDSSNTSKLFDLTSSIKGTIWVENKSELEIEKLKNYSKVGIVSGTSTSLDTINEIVEVLKNI